VESESGEVTRQPSPWLGLFQKAGEALVPVLVTAGSLIGFVAFAGAVIVWTRFSAAKVPADQAVAALPQDELVAIGSSLLLIFGFFGALAVLAIFLIDRGGRTTPGMSRGLLLLLMVEGVAAIVLVDGPSLERSIVAIEAFLLPMAIVFWSTFAAPFIELDQALPDRVDDEPEAELEDRPFRNKHGGSPVPLGEALLVFALAIDAALVGGAVTLFAVDGSPLTAGFVALTVFGAILATAVGLHCQRFYAAARRNTRQQVERRKRQRAEEERSRETELRREEEALKKRDWPKVGMLRRARRAREARGKKDGDKAKPFHIELRRSGVLLMVGMMAIGVVGPSLLLGKTWLAAALAAAVVLVAGLWRIAALAETRFLWYGLAVFISVPLFGTLMLMARNLADPQVQPIALIREADGPDEAIQGLYVTEGDDRVYFATVSTEGCSDDLAPHSGRLLWVPKDEVVAMAIGPLQGVDDAGRSALEMSYALTPDIETPTGDHVSLAVDEEDESDDESDVEAKSEAKGAPVTPAGKEGAVVAADGRRLESTGAAVRPNFGAGLSLEPESAPPGEEVTVRMSAPNVKTEGFGTSRAGHNLRLGGVIVDIAKEPATSAESAEYIKTDEGRLVRLAKEGAYVAKDSGFVLLEDAGKNPSMDRYVKLDDPSWRALGRGPVFTEGDDLYVKVAIQDRSAVVAADEPEVQLAPVGAEGRFQASETVTLSDLPLYRQAWHRDNITFLVPKEAKSGVVSVECDQLAGQSLLHVSRPSTARITVRMRSGSQRLVFDSRRSGEEGGQVTSRQWTIAGRPAGGRAKIPADLPPRRQPYSVQLTVTNADGQTDTARLKLLRLPAWLFETDKDTLANEKAIRRARKRVRRTVAEAPPVAIELHGHADDVGTDAYNLRLALRRAVNLRDELLRGKSSALTGETDRGKRIPVTTRAFGETCPIDRRSGPRKINRRVEIFILGRGTIVTTPEGCRANRVKQTRW
jgi:outer membrane protein OmpA-like peptidoglycan-associated protein/uncharacterized membrane protein YiaA